MSSPKSKVEFLRLIFALICGQSFVVGSSVAQFSYGTNYPGFGTGTYYPASDVLLGESSDIFPCSPFFGPLAGGDCSALYAQRIGEATYWLHNTRASPDVYKTFALNIVDAVGYFGNPVTLYRECEIQTSVIPEVVNGVPVQAGFTLMYCSAGLTDEILPGALSQWSPFPDPGLPASVLSFNPYDPGAPGPFPPSPRPSPTGQVDLRVSNLTLSQPIGVDAPLDSAGNPILQTITPPTSVPAPKVTAVPAEARITVNMTGTPSGATTTDVQLKLGSQLIATQTIDTSRFQPGDNVVKVDFLPPTDPSFLGILPLTATVNASRAVLESSYTDNSLSTNIKTMVLCKVEDAGRVVPFYAQTQLPWALEPYGIPTLSSGTFKQYGCSVTDLDMLFSSYGITNTPIGSPVDPVPTGLHMAGLNGESLDPGTLNSAMANYTTNFFANGSVAFDSHNNPDWFGAAEVARAGYQAQCQITGSCDPANAPNVVSYKGQHYGGYSEPAAIKAIQNEICHGNPVIMKFAKNPTGQHFMLATGIALDPNSSNAQTLRVNNPGSNQPVQNSAGTGTGAKAFYSNPALRSNYPSILGYILYRQSSDPSMMFIAAPMGVHFVVTDPLGRRAGFNPNTGTSYAEIPDADYGEQSIDTPADPGFTPSTLVDERYFMSSEDVPPGSYNIQVFSLTGGDYYLDYRGTDSSGTTNDSRYKTGTLAPGDSTTVAIKHLTTAAPRPNAVLTVSQYAIQDTGATGFKQTLVKIAGTIAPNSKSPVSIQSSVQISIGGITGYQFYLPASDFTSFSTADKKTMYISNSPAANVHIDSTGAFEIDLRGVDLSDVDQNLLGAVSIEVDSTIGGKMLNLNCHQGRCTN